MRACVDRVGRQEHLGDLFERYAEVRSQLQADVDEAAENDGEDSGDGER